MGCVICGAADIALIGRYRAKHPSFAGMQRAECRSCGIVFASPMPDDAALDAYNQGYFANAHGSDATGKVTAAFHSAINRLRVEYVEARLGLSGDWPGTVLEVGPGDGHFARHWLARHPNTDYHAVESDRTCYDALRSAGVEVHRPDESIENIPQLDLIILSHVLEHVAAPGDFLRSLVARLRSGGCIFIEVPCRDWEHKSIDEPHLLFFDKPPMSLLLARVGLETVSLSYHGVPIAELRRKTILKRALASIRSRLIGWGIVAPFDSTASGLGIVDDRLGRAVIRPLAAHIETQEPAWWLRAIAKKT